MTGVAIVHALLDAQPFTPAEFVASFGKHNRVGLMFRSIYGSEGVPEDEDIFAVYDQFLAGEPVFLGFVKRYDGMWHAGPLASNALVGRGIGSEFSRGPFGSREEAAKVLREHFHKP